MAKKKENKEFTLEGEIESALSLVNSGLEKTEEVIEVSKVIEYLYKDDRYKKLEPEELSRLSIKLSVLNINIGIKASEATMSANMSYGYKKFQYASQWSAIKQKLEQGATNRITNTEVENELTKASWDDFKTEMEAKLKADKLIALNQGIDSILIAIGYRLKSINQDRMIIKYNN